MNLQLPDVVLVRDRGYENLRAQVRLGELVRLRHGAYIPAAPADEPPWERRRREVLSRCVAVTRSFPSTFAFSHETAALIHGWSVATVDDRIHIVQSVSPGPSAPDVVRHRRDVRSMRVVDVGGLPVTAPEQTVLDCIRYLPPDRGLIVADSAFTSLARMSPFQRADSLARQHALRTPLAAALEPLARSRGVIRARAVLEYADGFAGSPGESRVRWLSLSRGLPVPVVQQEFWVDDDHYFSDLAWSGEGPGGPWLVIAEFDGALKYVSNGSDVLTAEKRREDALRRRHGANVVRLTTSDLTVPDRAFQMLVDAFPPGVLPPLRRVAALYAR